MQTGKMLWRNASASEVPCEDWSVSKDNGLAILAGDDAAQKRMRSAALEMAAPDAAKQLAEHVLSLASWYFVESRNMVDWCDRSRLLYEKGDKTVILQGMRCSYMLFLWMLDVELCCSHSQSAKKNCVVLTLSLPIVMPGSLNSSVCSQQISLCLYSTPQPCLLLLARSCCWTGKLAQFFLEHIGDVLWR